MMAMGIVQDITIIIIPDIMEIILGFGYSTIITHMGTTAANIQNLATGGIIEEADRLLTEYT